MVNCHVRTPIAKHPVLFQSIYDTHVVTGSKGCADQLSSLFLRNGTVAVEYLGSGPNLFGCVCGGVTTD